MDKVNMVPGFILKLWKMINDPQCDDLISWSENGQSFIITDHSKFSQELSKYFKHNNLSSFIRQLNMYGFRKVATIENCGLHPGTDDLHFYHPDFVRDKPDRLEAIKRKLPQKLNESVDLRNVIKGITEIEDKQKDVSKTLADIKRENEMLWAELHDLRQKHQQQQLYISRLMKLVFEAMEQNGIKTNMLQLKRDPPLMIEGGEESHRAKRSRLSTPEEGEVIYAPATIIVPTTVTSAVPSPTQDSAPVCQVPTISLETPGSLDASTPIVGLAPTSVVVTTPGIATSSSQVAVIPHMQPTIEQMPDFGGTHLDSTANYEPSSIEQTINENGDQLDLLIPTFADFQTENMDDFFNN